MWSVTQKLYKCDKEEQQYTTRITHARTRGFDCMHTFNEEFTLQNKIHETHN